MKKRRFAYPLLAAAAGLLALTAAACGEDTPDPGMETTPMPDPGMETGAMPDPGMEPAPMPDPDMATRAFDPVVYPNTTNLFVDFQTTRGNFTAILFDDLAPSIVDNFVTLARDEYYDGLTFHRVEPGFVIQGGDPNGDGSGGPGYQVNDEFHPAALHDSAGILSMANSGFNTNGSQFFVTLADTPHLDAYNSDLSPKNCPQQGVSCHAVFGRVVEGLEVAFSIAVGDVMSSVTIREEEGQPISSSTADGRALITSTTALEDGTQYYAAFETDRGNFRMQLRHDEAPRSVAHFVELARRGYYNGTTLASGAYLPELPAAAYSEQPRTPAMPGSGNSQVSPVVLQNDYSPELTHDGPGVASFILRGPNLSAGLFQITLEASPQLDAYNSEGEMRSCTGASVQEICFAVFGKVTEGLDAVTGLGSEERMLITRVIIQEEAP